MHFVPAGVPQYDPHLRGQMHFSLQNTSASLAFSIWRNGIASADGIHHAGHQGDPSQLSIPSPISLFSLSGSFRKLQSA